jgi:hypothetical protein
MAGRASRNKWTARADGERTGVCTYCFSDVAQRKKGASSLLGVAAPSLEDDMRGAYPVPQSQEKKNGRNQELAFPARVLREDIGSGRTESTQECDSCSAALTNSWSVLWISTYELIIMTGSLRSRSQQVAIAGARFRDPHGIIGRRVHSLTARQPELAVCGAHRRNWSSFCIAFVHCAPSRASLSNLVSGKEGEACTVWC